MQRHVFQQGAEIAEGVARQRVVVIRQRPRLEQQRGVLVGDHHDFRQRKSHALAQLVVVRQQRVARVVQLRGMDEPGFLALRLVDPLLQGQANPVQVGLLQ